MPFVDAPEDGVTFFYRTNLPGDGSAAFLDRSRPTILLLHGTIMDSSFMSLQLEDPHLSSAYNLIALDKRSSGQTRNAPEPSRDAWTEAADLAKLLERWQVPAAHILACGCIPVMAAQRLALLWPEKCLSVMLVTVPSHNDPEWVLESYRELLGMFMTAPDLETFEEAVVELFYHGFCDCLTEEQKDVIAKAWEVGYPPRHARRAFDYAMVVMHRSSLTPEELAEIRVPIMILQGDKSPVSPPETAFELAEQLVNAPNAPVKVHVLEGGPEQPYCIPYYAQIINSYLASFIASVPPTPPPGPDGDPMKVALSRLAKLRGMIRQLQSEIRGRRHRLAAYQKRRYKSVWRR